MTNNSTSGADYSAPVFRDLNADDVFGMIRVLKKIGLPKVTELMAESSALNYEPPMRMGKDGKPEPLPREEWTEAQEKAETDYLIANDKFSAKVVGIVFDNIADCQAEVYALIASGLGCSVLDVAKMSAIEFLKAVVAYFSREGFRDFFTEVLQLVTQKTVMS